MLFILMSIVFPLLVIALILLLLLRRRMGGGMAAAGAKGWSPAPRKVFRGVMHGVALIGILLILLIPSHPYDGMCSEEEWGGAPPASCALPDDPSGDGALFAGVLLVIVLALQLMLSACANNRWEIILPAVLMVLAICVWGLP
jgi:hypothetical protein